MNIFHIEPKKNLVVFTAVSTENWVLGYVSLTVKSDNTIKLHGAYVLEQHRGQGVYRELWLARDKYIKEHYPTYDQIGYVNKMSKNIFIENKFELTDVRKVLKKPEQQ